MNLLKALQYFQIKFWLLLCRVALHCLYLCLGLTSCSKMIWITSVVYSPTGLFCFWLNLVCFILLCFVACYKSEALSDAKRAVCLNPEWEKVSRKHGCLLTNLSLVIIYTCSSLSFASWRRNAALVMWIFLSSFLK